MSNVLFASWLNYLDQSNGASISTRSLLMELSRRGWSVKTLCGVGQDATPAKSLDELITTHNATVRKRSFCGDYATVSFTDGGVESLALDPCRPRRVPTPTPLPSASDVAPWVCAIVRLWDDAAFYEEKQNNGRNQARRWEFPTVADAHEARLTALLERAR